MIYLKNNTETQSIYIPRQTVLGGGYIPSTKAYDKGYNDGLEVGKEQQKGKLSNLNVTENGQYEREDGWNVVNVDVPDLNGSYNEGYAQGKTDGIDEQKSKLESINITENGVYSKEDGYNHIEVNVPSYEEGQADMAAKARVLNVTKNGNYLSKFSDPIIPTVTGVYADGTKFYSYAELNGKVFNTKIAGSIDSRLEFWYKGDNKTSYWDVIIGSGDIDDVNCFQVRYYLNSNNKLLVGINNSIIEVNDWDDTVWHHLIVSKAEGLWIDGEKKGDFSTDNTIDGEFFINGVNYGVSRNANGWFGMIKIDDITFIPTADGFLNTNTNELLQVVKDGTYTFTENAPIYGEGELYKTINVNVPDLNGSYDEGKIDGINEQKSKLETIEITQNATYNRADGYNKVIVKVPDLNGSYDEGYEQGQADIAENAIVLNVTENGVYKTKFSDPIMPTLVTGVYADGTEFYNYAQLNGKVFNTNIPATMDSRVELWYKGDNLKSGDGYNNIISTNDTNNSNIFEIIYWSYKNDEVRARIGSSYVSANWDETKWHHIIVSVSDGFVIDGEKKGDIQSNSNIPNGRFTINGTYDLNSLRNANGCFGMIKIDNTIIIPTADGFKNVNTGELLEVVKDGDYTFTKNLPTYGEGEIYKTINVNVPDLNGSYNEGKIDGINEQKSKLETINITQNGTYNREDGWNVVTVDVSIKYNTIADIYGSPSDSTVTFKGLVALSFDYKSGKNILFTDHTGSIILKNCQEPLKVGDECLVTATLRRNTLSYISDLSNASVEVLSSNNYVVMPADAVELTNLDNLYIPNEGGYAEMKYLYADGTVVSTTFRNNFMRIETDATRPDSIALRGDFSDWEGKLVEGDNIRVYMFPENNQKYFWVTDIIKLGAEGGSCNLEDKSVTPSTNDVDVNGIIEIRPDNGYDAMSRVAINVSTIKSEWTTIGKNSITDYDITAFTYKVYDWTSVNINRNNITNDCGDRPLDCLLFRNRSGECTVMTKFDTCSGTARLENGWNGDNIILSLKSNTITKFSSNSINSNQLTSIDTGFAKLEGNAITNCNALTDIKVTVLNDNLSTQFATNCFNGLPAEGTITIGKNVDVTITDNEITSFFRTIVGEGWTITIK